MKKYAFIAAVLVLTLSLLTGCGCTAKDSGMATTPSDTQSILPTNIPETTVPTEPATMPDLMPDIIPETTVPESSDTANSDEGMSDNSATENGASGKSRMR